MKVVKVRSPFIVEVAETGQTGSKIELSIWKKDTTIPNILSSVTITGTAGQFSCSASTFVTGGTITISGTIGGTGSITGYTSPKTYYIIATNGTTTFTLSETAGGSAITTTAGTPTGLTYIAQISGLYILSKAIPSTTQISTSYNVSNYVKEFIDNINASATVSEDLTSNNDWINFRVKRYKLASSTYTLLDTTDYVGVNGFTNYSNGKQNATTTNLTLLANNSLKYYYPNSTFTLAGYWNGREDLGVLNFLSEKLTTDTLSVRYDNIQNTYYEVHNLQIGIAGIFNYSFIINNLINSDNYASYYAQGCKITISLTGSTSIILYAYPTNEYKYTPVKCEYVNRYGGWHALWFFKQQTNAINVKGTDYKLMPSAINYNTSKGQVKSFNINGKQTVKLNTGFVDENYSEVITDLLLSETVLLDGKPATVKTQGSDLKTKLKDRLINYEIEFDYAFNLINDVV
jgi:hypothetical protein